MVGFETEESVPGHWELSRNVYHEWLCYQWAQECGQYIRTLRILAEKILKNECDALQKNKSKWAPESVAIEMAKQRPKYHGN